jgi:hypothetical protein
MKAARAKKVVIPPDAAQHIPPDAFRRFLAQYDLRMEPFALDDCVLVLPPRPPRRSET